ncbi:MAG TPA: NAD-dependent epimerase/dehydratase family protein [Candidatus Ozemobacteraceae bacterium]
MSEIRIVDPGLKTCKKILVTGGGGFLGKTLVKMLRERGLPVRSFSRGRYPELEQLGVECVSGDLGNPAAVLEACRDCDLVFHVASKPGIWGPYEEYYRVNVTGTENVVAACRKLGIRRLVYTSSPSVVFDGNDMENATESVPYPDHYETHYPATKAIAEKHVLAANGPDLATVALRPHLIWGPGDNHLAPRMVAAAKAGRLVMIGDNKNKVDTVYVDNAADAHILAAERLEPGSPVAGRAYFISNGDPRPLWDIVNMMIGSAGVPPLTRSISPTTGWLIGGLLELVYGLFHLKGEPKLTRFMAREMSTAHWFDLTAARRDLGYEPRVGIEEGMQRLAAWVKDGGLDRAPRH